jgi:hypothetical protein
MSLGLTVAIGAEMLARKIIDRPEKLDMKNLPPHTLFCACGQCEITPRVYKKAFE